MTLSYDPEIPNIRKEKILAFIEKDIFLLNNYETVPFKNKNHAIECLIPYHIFHLTADDIKFRGSDVEIDIDSQIEILKNQVKTMITEHAFDTDGFTPQLLLYHEQRVLNSIAQQAKAEQKVKKKSTVDRRAMRVRIPKTKLYYVSGGPLKIRMKIEKEFNKE